jgi:hypothetical protein
MCNFILNPVRGEECPQMEHRQKQQQVKATTENKKKKISNE